MAPGCSSGAYPRAVLVAGRYRPHSRIPGPLITLPCMPVVCQCIGARYYALGANDTTAYLSISPTLDHSVSSYAMVRTRMGSAYVYAAVLTCQRLANPAPPCRAFQQHLLVDRICESARPSPAPDPAPPCQTRNHVTAVPDIGRHGIAWRRTWYRPCWSSATKAQSCHSEGPALLRTAW
jgi:hypothetical protein